MIFKPESTASMLQSGLEELTKRHWFEVYEYEKPATCDWESFAKTEAENAYRWFSVRHGVDLVGYSGVYVLNDPHLFGKKIGVIKDIFIEKTFRNFNLVVRFIRYIEDELRKAGANSVVISDPTGKLARLYSKLGFDAIETIWEKKLGE